jgi:hypothetical protein
MTGLYSKTGSQEAGRPMAKQIFAASQLLLVVGTRAA